MANRRSEARELVNPQNNLWFGTLSKRGFGRLVAIGTRSRWFHTEPGQRENPVENFWDLALTMSAAIEGGARKDYVEAVKAGEIASPGYAQIPENHGNTPTPPPRERRFL